MPTALKSLYASDTLSMKGSDQASASAVQRIGVGKECLLGQALCGIFFDGLHQHMSATHLGLA